MTAPRDAATVPRRVLPILVLAQFLGTSPWFSANAILADLAREADIAPAQVGLLTSAVQLGFIAGTLCFALLLLADRFEPRRVFLTCSLLVAISNAALLVGTLTLGQTLASRFLLGFFLAGVYPVGMKIAASWYRQGLGAALGFLIGALALGTAAPHGLRAIGAGLSWQMIVATVSAFAAIGGWIVYRWIPAAPDGAGKGAGRGAGTGAAGSAHRPAPIRLSGLAVIWRDRAVRASAVGYFGHMWELYAVLVMMPGLAAVLLARHAGLPDGGAIDSALLAGDALRRVDARAVSTIAFAAIGAGAIGCALGGLAALRFGSARVASWQLATSGLCCLATPWLLQAPLAIGVAWLLLWGTTVIGDSPQLSALTASNSPPAIVGSVLTFANCIGFSISILTIQTTVWLAEHWPLEAVMPWLAAGPLAGWLALRALRAQPLRSPAARSGS